MKQLVQSVRNGELRLVDTPTPQIDSTQVLVRTTRSVVSAGTEKAVRQLASASLVQKAKARPDLVRQVIKKAKTEGLKATARTVQSRLDEDMPLGYSAAGVVVAVGEHVAGVRPGDRVATASAGHAEMQVVPGLLAVKIPEEVTDDQAAFATIGAIALNGLRLAEVGPGAKVVVIGLGLVGQLTCRLARAAGCQVAGLDARPWPVERAAESSADLALVDDGEAATSTIQHWTRRRGADAVIVTAATKASTPMHRAAELARDRGTLVLVGDVGLELDRRPLYDKELQLRVARSYGPGRYDLSYEGLAVDYPVGHVRWTEGRNLEAVLDMMAAGQLDVTDLVTHRFAFDRALDAYALLESDQPYLGIELEYRGAPTPMPAPARRQGTSSDGIGLIGAGAFARSVLVPGLQQAGFRGFVSVTSATGLSAAAMVERGPFHRTAESADELIEDPDVGVVVIATPHDTHAELAAKALKAGKHVYCEKPLALSFEELDMVEAAWRESGCVLMVGFNRRYSPAITAAKEALTGSGPLMIVYRVNAGPIPEGHWYNDRRQGGRLLGEVCHFIDTCNALVGDVAITSLSAVGTRAPSSDSVAILGFADESHAAICYGSNGHNATSKETVEILGRNKTIRIDNYSRVELNGRTLSKNVGTKGHANMYRELKALLPSGISRHTDAAIASMRITLAVGMHLGAAEGELTPFPAVQDLGTRSSQRNPAAEQS